MRTTVVIVGAGQAGLAMSRILTEDSIDHIVLERGTVANSWRTERWDSLRLLTPNWMTRLPGFQYSGPDPDGYMTADEVSAFLTSYRVGFSAPVQEHTEVASIETDGTDWIVITNNGIVTAKAVVLATGACSTPRIPAIGAALPSSVRQLAPIHYRNPGHIDADQGVLVVGASASGAQLADELARAGHDVTLAVGDHVRLPRTYRGMDIHWWLDTMGTLNDRYDDVEDIVRARRLPSLQLVGSDDRRDLGLNELSASGVTLAGRLAGVTDSALQFSGSFANAVASADLKQGRLLDAIDQWATDNGLGREIGPIDRPQPTTVPDAPLARKLDDIGTVIWATGFKPHNPWLPERLLDHKGAVIHDGGVTPEAGLYILGLPFLRHRNSSFIDGVGRDARYVGRHLRSHLDITTSVA